MRNKGQAAIEYLTTYGWAIMVLLLMVSSLAAFGVLDVRDWAPDRCELGAEFLCKDYVFVNNGQNVTLMMMLRNNLPDRVIIKSINCTFENALEEEEIFSPEISIGNEEEKQISCSTDDERVMSMNGKIKTSFVILYEKRDGLFEHEVSGSVFSGVS